LKTKEAFFTEASIFILIPMSAYCYILYSKSLDRFYIGATHDDLKSRVEKHNQGTYGKHRFTSTADDWKTFIKILIFVSKIFKDFYTILPP
ncbi:MAG: GIY-YIG nuclease family protein, partial [Bacteroidales bacterium]|nr:GIY-YIG nuclease family protein [Bacteroidales bacterium]MCF8376890.1 GIY-YIG nuclease family protein [Bacteroidales bacterium]MCF8400841.1 GIY-YIG nuclease family protein [Bacteroidales bacterium]